MPRSRRLDPEWRQFEQLVARIERDAGKLGLVITSPDRIRCRITNRLREVDASIRNQDGDLITLECRKRRGSQDVTWIEQLATKRRSLGASKTIAVSAAGFSKSAYALARENEIELKTVDALEPDQLNPLLGLNLVVFWHRRVELKSVELRKARAGAWTYPGPDDFDVVLREDADLFAPRFCNIDEGHRWSINHIWHQLQEAANPYASLPKMQPPLVRTAVFPYPGNVIVETHEGQMRLGDVALTVAIWWESEAVWQSAATIVSYGSPDTAGHHRLEFSSAMSQEEWAISLQVPADALDVGELRPGGTWPDQSGTARTGPRARPIDLIWRSDS